MTNRHGSDTGSVGEPRCPACGSEMDETWKCCGWCGAVLVADAASEQARTVTMVVSDLQGSTALAETLDPESLRLVLDRYFDELGAVFESYGGHIEKRIGDMMVIAFGFPAARDDDVVRALRATAEAEQALATLNEQLESGWGVKLVNRTGISTGTVVYVSGTGAHRVLAGDALDTAGGLEPVAPPLEALVSAETVALAGEGVNFGGPESFTFKNGEVVTAHRLLTVAPTTDERGQVSTDGLCGSCGSSVIDDHAWCTSCGVPLESDTGRTDSRRTLTIVFADIELVASHGEVSASNERGAMLSAFDTAREALELHGGTVEKFIGDAVMAVWGLEVRHEDDALRAISAAVEMRDRLAAASGALAAEFGVDVVVRIGVNTGAVIAGHPGYGERLVTGDAVNVAARLEQTADEGDVIIGGLTRQLAGAGVRVEALEPLTLKGKAEPVPAFRVSGFDQDTMTEGEFELPLTGRATELDALRNVWSETNTSKAWQRVSIVGEAGTGKSRLLHELIDEVDPTALVLRGACLAYGEGITFWPIAQILRSAAGITADSDIEASRAAVAAMSPGNQVAVRLNSLLGLNDRTVPVPELFWACRRLFEHLAASRPVLVVIDGLHWAEPTLVDLLDDLMSSGADAPVLLLTMERPVLGNEGDQDPSHQTIHITALDEVACDEMMTSALGIDALPSELRSHIVRTSGGVPLFVEQLLTMLIGEGHIVRDGDHWRSTAGIETLSVPPTIEALLAARVDALDDDERAVLEPASVFGRQFSREAVEHVAAISDAHPPLTSLGRRQMVSRLTGTDPIADHRFRNLMIRDVVYDGLLKRDRSQIHEQIADWMTAGPASGRISEFEEILGYHLEMAYSLGAEVATVGNELVLVGQRASAHLGAAGERAFARGDMPAAGNLLQRAARTLHERGPHAAHLLVMAADAVMETGAFAVAKDLYDEAEQWALDSDDEAATASAHLARLTLQYLTGDGADGDTALAGADRLLDTFKRAADFGGVARCWRLRAYVEMTNCRWGAAEKAAVETIEHAKRAGDAVLENRVRPALAGFALYGPTPVPEALRRCEQLLVDAGSDTRARALIEQFVAHLLALDGRFEEARELCGSARASLLELGWNFDAALVSIHQGPIEMMAGDDARAEAVLAADYRTLSEMGEQNYLSTTAALLAEAVRRQGRLDEADELVTESAGIAAEDDVFTQVGWRSVRVRLLAAEGRLDDAIALAEEAFDLAMTTDGPRAQGDALLDLAEMLLENGDTDGARQMLGEAAGRYGVKAAGEGLARADELRRRTDSE